jgi:uncharacterized protein DUF481
MRIERTFALTDFFPSTFFACLITVLFSQATFAEKTDVVHLNNGDQVTAEIKELSRGEMRLSTDAFGTIYVKWQDVDHIEGTKLLQVEMVDGSRFLARVHPEQESGKLNLSVSGEKLELDLDQVIYALPIKGEERLGNWDNSLSAGITYSKASEVTRWNVSASTSYRAEKYLASVNFNSLITDNDKAGTDSTYRNLDTTYYRYLPNRWLWFGSVGYQRNDELGVDDRMLVTGGVGRYISQSQNHEFLLAGGIAANYEYKLVSTEDGDDSNNTAEALLVADWRYFKLHTPKADIRVSFDLYPGLTESGRLRGDFNVRYRQELILDMFWNLRYFYYFDTEAPLGAESDSDYGVVTAVEYQF